MAEKASPALRFGESMADGVEFNITGIDSLLGKLEAVSRDLRYKGGRSALRRAAKLIEAEAKKNALQIDNPETANQIAKNISVRWSPRLFKRTGNLGFRIGVLGGARQYSNTRENVRSGRAGKTYKVGGSKSNPGGDTWYWRFIEFGRGPVRVIKRKRKKGPSVLANKETGEFFGKEVKAAAPQPFLRPALENNIQAATDVFAVAYGKQLDRLLKNATKKPARRG